MIRWLILLILVFVAAWVMVSNHRAANHVSECGTIHKPKQGCPAGFTEVPDFFEREGKKSPACIDPKRPQCVDVLYPGESIQLGVRFGRP